jgi:hypothetical protein
MPEEGQADVFKVNFSGQAFIDLFFDKSGYLFFEYNGDEKGGGYQYQQYNAGDL